MGSIRNPALAWAGCFTGFAEAPDHCFVNSAINALTSPCAREGSTAKNQSDLLQSSPWPGAPVPSVILQRADPQGTQGVAILQEIFLLLFLTFPPFVSNFSFFFFFTSSERHRRKPLFGSTQSLFLCQIRNHGKKQLETRENRLKAKTLLRVGGITPASLLAVSPETREKCGISVSIPDPLNYNLHFNKRPRWFLHTIRFEKLGKGKLHKWIQVLIPLKGAPLCEILGSQRHLVVSLVVADKLRLSTVGSFITGATGDPPTGAQRSPPSACLHHAVN